MERKKLEKREMDGGGAYDVLVWKEGVCEGGISF